MRKQKKKKLFFKKKCMFCGRKLFIFKYYTQCFLPDKHCEDCNTKYKMYLEKAKTMLEKKNHKCIVCGKHIRKGDVCYPCFEKIVNTCLALGAKARKVRKWELVKTRQNNIYKRKVYRVVLTRGDNSVVVRYR